MKNTKKKTTFYRNGPRLEYFPRIHYKNNRSKQSAIARRKCHRHHELLFTVVDMIRHDSTTKLKNLNLKMGTVSIVMQDTNILQMALTINHIRKIREAGT